MISRSHDNNFTIVQLKKNKKPTRSTQLLEIVRIDICGPFNVHTLMENNISVSLLMIIHIIFIKSQSIDTRGVYQ